MKCRNTVATRAAPFGQDMHQIVCRLGLCPRPHWGASAPPDPLAGLGSGTPGERKEGGEGNGGEGWVGLGPIHLVWEGKGMEGRMGVRG